MTTLRSWIESNGWLQGILLTSKINGVLSGLEVDPGAIGGPLGGAYSGNAQAGGAAHPLFFDLSLAPLGPPLPFRFALRADGFDLDAIEAMEPGLFAQPPTAANAPHYRLRRASGTVNDPLYARVVGGIRPLSLDRSDGTSRFAATFVDTSGLLPFVRYTWWAEVRLPAERRLPGGATMLRLRERSRPRTPHRSRMRPRPSACHPRRSQW